MQAVRLLVAMGSPWRKDGLLAHVDFAYRDGTRASMPLVANRDMGWILGVTTAPTAAKVAPPVWTGRNRSGEIDSEGAPVHVALYAPRIKNPHPDRELATLSIRMAADSPAGIWLFGITVEGAQLTTDNDRRGARR